MAGIDAALIFKFAGEIASIKYDVPVERKPRLDYLCEIFNCASDNFKLEYVNEIWNLLGLPRSPVNVSEIRIPLYPIFSGEFPNGYTAGVCFNFVSESLDKIPILFPGVLAIGVAASHADPANNDLATRTVMAWKLAARACNIDNLKSRACMREESLRQSANSIWLHCRFSHMEMPNPARKTIAAKRTRRPIDRKVASNVNVNLVSNRVVIMDHGMPVAATFNIMRDSKC